jgi:hypothetical protein
MGNIIAKVKVFNKVKHQGQGHMAKLFCTHEMILSQGTLMQYVKALVPTNQKI